eukprot:Sspe_Gene.18746::Locus_6778_Transcript_1_1_Confidence_1.000_Length_10139::g.18746::m.18746/K10408/DNAH; dynein heavy chain, axonemal
MSEELVEKATALHQELVGLGVKVLGEYDRDSDGEVELLCKLYEAYLDYIRGVREFEELCWKKVKMETIIAEEKRLSDIQASITELGERVHTFSVYGDLCRGLEQSSRIIALSMNVRQAPMLDGHYRMLLSQSQVTEVGEDTDPEDMIVRQLFALLENPDSMMLCQDLVDISRKEEMLRNSVNDLETQLHQQRLPLADGSGTFVVDIEAAQQLLATLSELRSNAYAILESKHKDAVLDLVEQLIEQLCLLKGMIAGWADAVLSLERLEAVLRNEKVQGALQEEMECIKEANKGLSEMMALLTTGGVVGTLREIVHSQSSQDQFEMLLDSVQNALQKCEEQLQERIDMACEMCPRFHFLDEKVLLQIIAGSEEAAKADDPFLPLIIPSVQELVFGDEDGMVVGVRSVEGEILHFAAPLHVERGIYHWATPVIEHIKNELAGLVKQAAGCVEDVVSGQGKITRHYLDRFPAQVSLIGLHIMWTRLIEGTLGVTAPPETPPSCTPVPGLSPVGSVRPHVGASHSNLCRPTTSAKHVKTGWQTPEQRLQTLTSPLLSDAGVRPGSAPPKSTKAKPPDDEEKTKKIPGERRRSSAKGRTPDKPKTRPETRTPHERTKRKSIVRTSSARPGSALRSMAITPTTVNTTCLDQAILDAPIEADGVRAKDGGGKSRWVTSVGPEEARRRLRSVLSFLTELSGRHLTALKRCQVEACTTLVHHLVRWVESGQLSTINDANDFAWRCMPRIYPAERGYVIKMGDFSAHSGLEYSGPMQRTPLTPGVTTTWLHIAQTAALQKGAMLMGDDPQWGLETMRGFALLASKYTPILECTKDTTVNQLASFFSGVVSSGGWGVLHKVCAMEDGVVATAAILADKLREAQLRGKRDVAFGGRLRQLSPHSAIFATARPQVNSVTTHLNSHFRHIAVAKPDVYSVANTLFTMLGLQTPTVLARRIDDCLRLLRATADGERVPGLFDAAVVPAIVQRVARMLRTKMLTSSKVPLVEDIVVTRACREVLGAAMHPADLPRLEQALDDTFPTQTSFVKQIKVDDVLQQCIADAGLSPCASWEAKVLDLYDAQSASQSLCLVGGAFTGKSECTRVLLDVLRGVCCLEYREVRVYAAACPASLMWGSLCEKTHKWVEGVVARKLRELAATPNNSIHTWFILDGVGGDLDYFYCMADRSRRHFALPPFQPVIPLSQHTSFAIETGDASALTPATLNYFSVVFFSDEVVPPEAIMISKIREKRGLSCVSGILTERRVGLLRDALSFVTKSAAGHMVNATHSASTVTSLMEGVLGRVGRVSPSEEQLELLFWWCLSWGAAGALSTEERSKYFTTLVFPHIHKSMPKDAETIFDCCLSKNLALEKWVSPSVKLDTALLATNPGSTLSYLPGIVGPAPLYFIDLYQTMGANLVLYGPHGCGKTTAARAALDGTSARVISFARRGQTTCDCVLAACLEKPPQGQRKVTVLLDDVGTQLGGNGVPDPSELVRQAIETGKVYLTKDGVDPTEAESQKDISWMATCAPTHCAPRVLSSFLPVYLSGEPWGNAKDAVKSFTDVLSSIFTRNQKDAYTVPHVTVQALRLLATLSPEYAPKCSVEALVSVMKGICLLESDTDAAGLSSLLLGELVRATSASEGDVKEAMVQAYKHMGEEEVACRPCIFIPSKTMRIRIADVADGSHAMAQQLQQGLGNDYTLPPSSAALAGLIASSLMRDGGGCFLRGLSGCGRKVLTTAVAEAVNMKTFRGASQPTLEEALSHVLSGGKAVLIVPEDEMEEEEVTIALAHLHQAGELADPNNAHRLKFLKDTPLQSQSAKWLAATETVRRNLHMALCVPPHYPFDRLPAALRNHLPIINMSQQQETALEVELVERCTTDCLAVMQSRLSGHFTSGDIRAASAITAQAHVFAVGVSKKKSAYPVHIPPFRLLQAAAAICDRALKMLSAQKKELGELEASLHRLQNASIELSRRTGQPAKMLENSDCIAFSCFIDPESLLPLRLAIEVDTINENEDDEERMTISKVHVAGLFLQYGEEPGQDVLALQECLDSEYKDGKLNIVVTGKPGSELKLSGKLTYSAPVAEDGSPAGRKLWCYSGVAQDAALGVNAQFGATQTDAPPSVEWLQTGGGILNSGAEVYEPDWVAGKVAGEARDALAREVHDAIEQDRSRIHKMLKETKKPSLLCDSVVSSICLTYGCALPYEMRRKLWIKVLQWAESDFIVSECSDPFVMHGMWQGVDKETAYSQWMTALCSHRLPYGDGWADAMAVVQGASHVVGTDHPVFPFFYDPHCQVLNWLRSSEEATREGPEVVVTRCGDSCLEATFAEALKKGWTLIIENVAAADWPRLSGLLQMKVLRETGYVITNARGIAGNKLPYSDRFRMFMISDPGAVRLPLQFHTHCLYVDAAMSPTAISNMLCSKLSKSDFEELVAEVVPQLSEYESCGRRTRTLMETLQVKMNQKDMGRLENVIDLYYSDSVREMLGDLAQLASKMETLKGQIMMVRKKMRELEAEHSYTAERVSLVYSAVETVATATRSYYRLMPQQVQEVALATLQASSKLTRDGATEKVAAAIFHLAAGTMEVEDRQLLSLVLALQTEMAPKTVKGEDGEKKVPSAVTPQRVQQLVKGSAASNPADQRQLERERRAQIDASHKAALVEYHQKQAQLNKQWEEEQRAQAQADEEQDGKKKVRKGADRPASGAKGKTKGKTKGAPEQLPIPQKAPLPLEVKPSYEWLSHRSWAAIRELAKQEFYAKLPESLHDREKGSKSSKEQKWLEWISSLSGKIPDYDKTPPSRFEKLALMFATRPDRSLPVLHKYIAETVKFADPHAAHVGLQLNDLFAHSRYDVPFVFLISNAEANTECLHHVVTLAKGKKKTLTESSNIVLQKGGEEGALDAVKQGLLTGTWVMLVNAHVMHPSFIDNLQLALRESPEPVEDFRLFLTYIVPSSPSEPLPHPIATSLKLRVGPPVGVRSAMISLFSHLADTSLTAFQCAEWQRLLFVLLLVAVLLRERMNVAPEAQTPSAAFAIPTLGSVYESVSIITFLHRYLRHEMEKSKGTAVPTPSWDAVRNAVTVLLTSSVTDDYLRAVITTTVDWWIHPDVVKPGMQVCKGFTVPDESDTVALHRQIIEAMPHSDSPELFGLHPVCELEAQQATLERLFSCIRGRLYWYCDRVTAVLEGIAKRLPPVWHEQAINHTVGKANSVPPVSGSCFAHCLVKEIRSLNELLNAVRSDVEATIASPGDTQYDEIRLAVYDGRVPSGWKKIWDVAELGIWMGVVEKAHRQLESWRAGGAPPRPLWLGGLSSPSDLLLALRREVCRSVGKPISSSAISAVILHPRRAPAPGTAGGSGYLVIMGLTLQ